MERPLTLYALLGTGIDALLFSDRLVIKDKMIPVFRPLSRGEHAAARQPLNWLVGQGSYVSEFEQAFRT